jgi:hypothetical protein
MSEINNESIDLSKLTEEQLSDIKKRIIAEEKTKNASKAKERETYKCLVNDEVEKIFSRLKITSATLESEKKKVFDSFATILKMKADIFGTNTNQQTHTFSSIDGSMSITIGNRVTDKYDDTINSGIQKVMNYLRTLAKDENSSDLIDAIMSLLKTDDKGNMRPSRVIDLKNMAETSGNEEFIDGISIIMKAYKPEKTCQFVSASYKDAITGKEVFLPLSMSSAK